MKDALIKHLVTRAFSALVIVAIVAALAYAAGAKKRDLCKCGIACECADAAAP